MNITTKEMKVILLAVRSAKESISTLACENYPYGKFEDAEFRKMFYELNDMCIAIGEKIDAAEAAEEGATK